MGALGGQATDGDGAPSLPGLGIGSFLQPWGFAGVASRMVNSRSAWTREQADHLLARAGFCGSPSEVEAAMQAGPEQTVARLLTVEPDEDLFPVGDSFSDKEIFMQMARALMESRKNPEMSESARKMARQAELRGTMDLRAWWLRRMRYSPNPLREKMTLFWHGHFACSVVKVRNPRFLWRQNELFRGFAFGDFRQLAKEIPRDPSMMRYLDIANSSKSKPNENFARELMELFLLGEGNYSEEDIRESARAFTGYRIDPMSQEVRFQGQRADTGTKTFFGKTGAFTSDDIVEILVNQPQCARFITGKLWNFFAGSPPTEKTQAALAETFRSSGFQTAAVLKAMFLSPEFYSKEVMKSQIKSPVDWMVGSSKRLESPLTGSRAEQNALRDLGQSLFEPPNVKGWEGGRTWVSASTFILRCNLAGTLLVPPVDLKNAFPTETRKDPETLCDAACLRLLGGAAPDRETFLAFLKTKESPASDATVSDLLRLMMNSPEFQLT